jgi:hypothetical protein
MHSTLVNAVLCPQRADDTSCRTHSEMKLVWTSHATQASRFASVSAFCDSTALHARKPMARTYYTTRQWSPGAHCVNLELTSCLAPLFPAVCSSTTCSLHSCMHPSDSQLQHGMCRCRVPPCSAAASAVCVPPTLLQACVAANQQLHLGRCADYCCCCCHCCCHCRCCRCHHRQSCCGV